MTLFRKKADPISARSKELAAQISALEQQIRHLSSNIEHGRGDPAEPAARLAPRSSPVAAPTSAREPLFERVDRRKPKADEIEPGGGHFNDLGVRKYDLPGAMRRVRGWFSSAPAANPKLVTYLAAGSVKGLRPLRYEKRVARNRFIFLSVVFAMILWGLIAAFFNHR